MPRVAKHHLMQKTPKIWLWRSPPPTYRPMSPWKNFGEDSVTYSHTIENRIRDQKFVSVCRELNKTTLLETVLLAKLHNSVNMSSKPHYIFLILLP